MKLKLHFIIPGLLSALLFSCSQPFEPAAESPAKPAGSSLKAPFQRETERPGLATGWGEEKRSEIGDRHFVRASSKPAGIDSIYYNNKEGIKAMSNYSTSVEPLQTAAGGLVEWGIKGRMGYLPSFKETYVGRRMISGENNGTYSIFVRNRAKSALEIVASVDGLDVQDGKPASFAKRGYIVGAGETLTIDGFRTSESTVAAFRFSSVSNSYANLRHGNTRNVGVIGIAVFTEKGVDPWTWMPSEINRRMNARTFSEAPASR